MKRLGLRSIRSKLVVMVLLLTVAPFAALGYLASVTAHSSLATKTGEFLESQAREVIDKIDRRLSERCIDARVLAANPEARGTPQQQSEAANVVVEAYGEYDLVIFTDAGGRITAASTVDHTGAPLDTSALIGLDVSSQQWWREAMAAPRGRSACTDAAFDPLVEAVLDGRGLQLGFTAPIWSDGAEPVGVVSGRVSFDRTIRPIMDDLRYELIEMGLTTIDTQVLNAEGFIIDDASPVPALEQNLAEMGLVSAQRAVAGENGYHVQDNVRYGHSQVNGYAHSRGAPPFPGFGWSVLVRQDTDEAAASALAVRNSVLALTLVGILVVTGTGVYASQAISRPIRRTAQALERVGEGNLDVRLEVSSRDEIGQMSEVFNATIERSRMAMAELQRSEANLRAAQAIAEIGSMEWPFAGGPGHWSPQVWRVLDLDPSSVEASRETWLGFVDGEELPRLRAAVEAAARTGVPYDIDYEIVTHQGRRRVIRERGELTRSQPGAEAVVVCSVQDVTARREAERALARQATHDQLTGLPNRTLLLDRANQALAHRPEGRGLVAMLFCDLDRFKVVNDSLGHAVGDRILVEASRRIRSVLRPSDTVARFGGDEFVVLCDEVSGPAEAEQLATRLVRVLGAPFTIGARELHLGVSVGIALARPGESDSGPLIRDADTAMYAAKSEGRGRYRLYSAELRHGADARLDLEEDLRKAMSGGELVLEYQPVVRLPGCSYVGAEALLRWHHPTRGILRPGDFLHLAEEAGLMLPLGRWVIEEACRQLAAWDAQGLTDFFVAVDVSPLQLADASLVSTVSEALEANGVGPGRLHLELSETALALDQPTASVVLWELDALGVQLTLDDFGAGSASLAHLRRLPLGRLKISRQFLAGLGSDPSDRAIVATVLAMGETLGLEVVAEGVETEEAAEALEELGCRLAQGSHYCDPCPAAQIPECCRA